MAFKRINRLIKRTLGELSLDYKNKDYKKIIHFFYFLPKQLLLKYPRNISIEPINTCNLECEFCSSPPKLLKRDLKAFNLDEFKKTIDEIKDVTHYLWLFLAGEPFLNPHFCDMVAYATKNNLHTTTSSNALLIDKEKARKIVEAGLDNLIISFDGASKETYEQMRLGGNFEKLQENIKFILKEKKKQGKLKPKIQLQFLVSKINQHEKEEFIKIAKGFGVDYCFKTLGVPTWVYDRNFCQELSNKYLSEKTGRYQSGKLKRNIKCSNAERSVILANGKISICCYDLNGEFNIGDVNSKSFLNIWQNKRYKKIRKLMEERKLPICKTCGETTELYE